MKLRSASLLRALVLALVLLLTLSPVLVSADHTASADTSVENWAPAPVTIPNVTNGFLFSEITGRPAPDTWSILQGFGAPSAILGKPIEIALVLDLSGSMDEDSLDKNNTTDKKYNIVSDAAATLLNELYALSNHASGDLQISISFTTFSDNAYSQSMQGIASASANGAITAADFFTYHYTRTGNLWGLTNIGEAFRVARGTFSAGNASEKYLILLTDGLPTTFSDSTGDPLASADAEAATTKNQGITVFTVAAYTADVTPGQQQYAEDNMARFASPGCAYIANNAAAIIAAFTGIKDDVTSSAEISVTFPANFKGPTAAAAITVSHNNVPLASSNPLYGTLKVDPNGAGFTWTPSASAQPPYNFSLAYDISLRSIPAPGANGIFKLVPPHASSVFLYRPYATSTQATSLSFPQPTLTYETGALAVSEKLGARTETILDSLPYITDFNDNGTPILPIINVPAAKSDALRSITVPTGTVVALTTPIDISNIPDFRVGVAVWFNFPSFGSGGTPLASTDLVFSGNDTTPIAATTGARSLLYEYTAPQGIDWIIVSTADPGGTIVPLGTVTVPDGGSKHYDIVPAAKYTIRDVLVDGVSVGAVSTYDFIDVHANHRIHASFATIPELPHTGDTTDLAPWLATVVCSMFLLGAVLVWVRRSRQAHKPE